jgi:toxin HigB-1
VIKSFRHKGLAEYFSTGSHRKIQAKHAERLSLILGLLHAATSVGALGAPALGLHPLKGKPKRWAVRVDENFRVIFRFEDGHALEVDYDDYH